jgi:SNF2 family DNA or RNA helicase
MLPVNYNPRTTPFQHQREALEAGWRRPGFGYLLEMGLGKSRVLIDNFCLLHLHDRLEGLLVIAPKGVYTNWSRRDNENPGELQRWLWSGIDETAYVHTWNRDDPKKSHAAHTALLDTTRPGVRVLVMNVEALSMTAAATDLARRFLRAHRSMIVVDESTVMQDPRSTRTKRLLELSRLAAYRRILTGSPTKGLPTDLFCQFEFLERGALGHRSYYTFRAAYCTMRDIIANGRTVHMITGAKNTDQLAKIIERHSIRKRKAECLDLPEKVYERRSVELTAEQKRVYNEMRKTAMAEMDGEFSTSQIVVTQLLRLHQILCGHLKLDDGEVIRLENNRIAALQEVIDESDESTIIWCNYRSDIAAVSKFLRETYGRDCVAEWHGGVNQAERDAGELAFQAGEKRFMLASQQAGGRGRNWTKATLVVYYSNNHDLELREQSEDRAHRIGQRNTVTYVDLVVPQSLDEKIINSLRTKKDVVRGILQDGAAKWL